MQNRSGELKAREPTIQIERQPKNAKQESCVTCEMLSTVMVVGAAVGLPNTTGMFVGEKVGVG